MRIIGLLLAITVVVTAAQAAHAQAVPWPSISPSMYCDDGVTVFTLYNVGTDMQAAQPWVTRTPTRIVDTGLFWIAAGQKSEWRYNAPHIPLRFTYTRPDTGAKVDLELECSGAQPGPTATPPPTVTPVGTPEFPGGTEGGSVYLPLYTR